MIGCERVPFNSRMVVVKCFLLVPGRTAAGVLSAWCVSCSSGALPRSLIIVLPFCSFRLRALVPRTSSRFATGALDLNPIGFGLPSRSQNSAVFKNWLRFNSWFSV